MGLAHASGCVNYVLTAQFLLFIKDR
jgi:hypothetical protein